MVVLETRAPLQERVDPECLSRDPFANTRGFHGEGLALRTAFRCSFWGDADMWCRDIAASGWLSWRRSAPCVCGVREGCGVPRAVLLVVGGGGEPGRLWPPPRLQPLSF